MSGDDDPSADVGDDLDRELRRWLADAAAGEAASKRSRQHWLGRQAEEQAELVGVVLDLVERQATVSVRTTAGHTLRGHFVVAGRDFCVLTADRGSTTFLPYAGLAAIRARDARPRAAARGGDGHVTASLAAVLLGVGGDRRRVRWAVTGDPHAANGELLGVGVDVVTFLPDGEPSTVYVPMATLAELTLLGTG